MSNYEVAVDRGALVGAMIAVLLTLSCARLYRSLQHRSTASPGAMFASTAYRVTVVVQVIAIVAGNLVLNAIGHQQYIIAWVAAVVGVHFLGFGRLFWSGFYWLGTALLAAAVSGAIVGLASGGGGRIVEVTGLLAATILFIAGMSTVLRARTVPDQL